jgi:AAA15 family ATPase/GTPase
MSKIVPSASNAPSIHTPDFITMLIEFKVTNFRSIRETQKLSLAATSSTELEKNIFSSGIDGLPPLAKSAVIYGPNAAGKSNLVQAIDFLQNFVKNSAKESQGGEPIDVIPFLLDEKSKNSPTEFEVMFITKGMLYEYGFALTKKCVTHEWLFAYPEGKAQKWFERFYESENQTWFLNKEYLKGQCQLWQDSTRANALFLSTAVMLNSVSLKPILEWITQTLVIFQERRLPHTIQQCEEFANKQKIMAFLQTADLGIADIRLDKNTSISFVHISSDKQKEVLFPENYESADTLKLFALAGPLFEILEQGQILIVDEMDTSIHPMMMRFIIGIIHNPELNKHGTQMIFTTHDSSTLDNTLLRPDQVWFVEKDNTQATQLYPLTDFIPRQNESLQKGYLDGRYGALPCLSELNFDENS